MPSQSEAPFVDAHLQLDQELRFQRRLWRAQRVAWIVMVLIIVAALLGLFGDGPLSNTTITDDDGRLAVTLGRVERHRSPSTVELAVSADYADGNGELRIWAARDWVDSVQTEGIEPPPDRVELSDERLIYTFVLASGARRVLVTFDVLHQGVGNRRARFGVEDGPSVAYSQIVLP